MTISDSLREDQSEMWATLTGPPEQLLGITEWLHRDQILLKKLNRTSYAWYTIDLNEVIRKFKIACIEYSINFVKDAQPIPIPNYWKQVEAASQLCIDALNGYANLADASNAADSAHDIASQLADSIATKSAERVADVVYYAAFISTDVVMSSQAAAMAARTAATAVATASGWSEDPDLYVGDLMDILINIILSEHANKGCHF